MTISRHFRTFYVTFYCGDVQIEDGSFIIPAGDKTAALDKLRRMIDSNDCSVPDNWDRWELK